jgi:hypothetical protein
LFGTLSLTVCDSGNEKDDDTEAVGTTTETVTVQGTNSADIANASNYSKVVASDPHLTSTVILENGQTAKQSIQAALAATKSGATAADAAAESVKFVGKVQGDVRAVQAAAAAGCSGS